MTLVRPNLFVGSVVDAQSEIFLKRESIGAALSLTTLARGECQRSLFHAGNSTVHVRDVEVDDTVTSRDHMSTLLHELATWVNDKVAAGTPTLVFCHKGQSRSVTVVLSFLMLNVGWTLRHAFWHVRGKRRVAFPNMGFFAVLQNLEEETHGKQTMPYSSQEYMNIHRQKLTRDPMKSGCQKACPVL